VKLGLATPGVVALPGTHAAWESDAGIDEIATVAEAADRLGYHHLTCSEHVAIPADVAPARGARYWDPLATFGYLAARTARIRFATHVVVLGYHHPLAIAKRYGTLDQVCGGRLILGLGVGTLAEEFALLGAQFDGRGERADDAVRALRASLSRREPSYTGSHYRFEGLVVDPCARQDEVPLWIGGRTARSLRRAVELGDGWVPFGLSSEELEQLLARARGWPSWQERANPLTLVLQNRRPLDPLGDKLGVRQRLARFRELGTDYLNVSFAHDSVSHCVDQLAAMAELAAQ
jgi:probable F420-dependent oxidoreductase